MRDSYLARTVRTIPILPVCGKRSLPLQTLLTLQPLELFISGTLDLSNSPRLTPPAAPRTMPLASASIARAIRRRGGAVCKFLE